MTRPAPYLSRPLGPGTPGVEWDALKLMVMPGAWGVCFRNRLVVYPALVLLADDATEACEKADRTARRLARRKGKA